MSPVACSKSNKEVFVAVIKSVGDTTRIIGTGQSGQGITRTDDKCIPGYRRCRGKLDLVETLLRTRIRANTVHGRMIGCGVSQQSRERSSNGQ